MNSGGAFKPHALGVKALPQLMTIYFLHGPVGFLDELALIACILVVAIAVVAFYFAALRKSKDQ